METVSNIPAEPTEEKRAAQALYNLVVEHQGPITLDNPVLRNSQKILDPQIADMVIYLAENRE